VTYIGTRYGKPLIAIKGGGAESTVRITINGYSIQINDVQAGEVLYIDSEQKLVRDNNGQMIYNRVSGRYPMLDFGSSTISWTGELEYLKMIKNERWL
jgi:phage-related protein